MTRTHPDADKAVGQALANARTQHPPIQVERAMSQAILAEQMRRLGWSWTQATVSKVETGGRELLLSEAVDLARLLHVPLAALLPPEDQEP